MAHLVLVLSGTADDPHEVLDGATPLAAAATPNLDALAAAAEVGLVHPVPELPADSPAVGADRAMLALLGGPPQASGRAAAELLGADADLGRRDVGVRFDLLSLDPFDPFPPEPTPDEARALWDSLVPALSRARLRIRPAGRSRALGWWSEGPDETALPAPGELTPEIAAAADLDDELGALISAGREVLAEHPVNRARRERHQPTYDLAWPWGLGPAPSLPIFALRRGQIAVGVTDNLAVRGVFQAARIPCPPATARPPTEIVAAATAALAEAPTVIVQTSIVDWVAHRGDPERKQRAIARLDAELIGPLSPAEADLTILADYACVTGSRRHAARPVPYLRRRRERAVAGPRRFDESAAAGAGRLREGAESIAAWLWGR